MSAEYKIKISYQTGNSLSYEDTSDYLELTWTKLDIAKDNLKRIKEHYEQYLELNDFRYNNKKEHEIFAFPTNYGRVGSNKEILYYFFCDELGEELSSYDSKQINNFLITQKLLGILDSK